MKKQLFYILAALLLSAANFYAQENVRVKENFNFEWKFILDDNSGYSAGTFSDATWENVQLPHDWSIKQNFSQSAGGSNAYLGRGIAWYRKSFSLPESYQGKKVSLLFDGVFQKSTVYVNGQLLGFNPYGFGNIELDLTPHLKASGTNTIAVRVDNSGNIPEYYTGSGIYRHAWLQAVNPVHIKTHGTYVTTPNITPARADIKMTSAIVNTGNTDKTVAISQYVLDASGNEVARNDKENVALPANDTLDVIQEFSLANPQLWSLETPNMYTVKTTVKINGETVDIYKTPFGIRTIEFNANRGFLLNGQSVKLKGVCLRQDAGVLGTALPDRVFEYRLKALKEYGCNAIRTGYCPPSPEFLNYCDQLGLLVIDETLEKWGSGYYSDYFNANWKKDMENIILRDRNHPSVILWGVGNEVKEATESTGVALATEIKNHVQSLDPTRKAMIALQYGFNESFADVFDVVGYNYMEDKLVADKATKPNRLYLVSETSPFFSRTGGNPLSYNQNNPWHVIAKHDYIAGGFIWAGVDYLGNAEWPGKGFPNGLFDVCMHEKSRSAYHRSVWSGKPVVSIEAVNNTLDIFQGQGIWQSVKTAAHWTFPARQYHVLPLRTVTNCEKVELYHGPSKSNLTKMGEAQLADFINNTIPWHLKWEGDKNVIEARGFIGGKLVATHTIAKTGSASTVRLMPDRVMLKSDGQDISFITVELLDESGFVAQTDDREITVTVTGEGKLIGIDNGNLLRDVSFSSNKLKSYLGKALILVSSTRESGDIRVAVNVNGVGRTSVVNLYTGKLGVSETSIEGMSYEEDNGPSKIRQFTFQGNLLTNDVRIEASAGFEVSLDGAGFSSTVTVPTIEGSVPVTTVYVRMSEGFKAGTHSGEIAIASQGEKTIIINLVGKVESKKLSLIYDFSTDIPGQNAQTPPAQDMTIGKGNSATAGVVSYTDANGLSSNVFKPYGGGSQSNGTAAINLDLFTKESTNYSVTWKQYITSSADYKIGILLRGDTANIGTSSTGYALGMMYGYLFIAYNNAGSNKTEFRIYKPTSSTSMSWLSNVSVDALFPAIRKPMWYRASVSGSAPVVLKFEYSTDNATTWKTATSYSDGDASFLSGATQIVWGLGSNSTGFYLDDIRFEGKTFAGENTSSTIDTGTGIPVVNGNAVTVVSEEYYTIMGCKVSSDSRYLKGLYIVRYIMSDGSAKSKKKYIK
jgi:beta-galactosidase